MRGLWRWGSLFFALLGAVVVFSPDPADKLLAVYDIGIACLLELWAQAAERKGRA